MFSAESGASRAGFISLAAMLFERGFLLIDSQVHTDYVAGMGGVDIPRGVYLNRLPKPWNCLTREARGTSCSRFSPHPIDWRASLVRARHGRCLPDCRIICAFPLH